MDQKNNERHGFAQRYEHDLGELSLDLEPVGFDELPALAERHGLSCYDAAYLWLALAQRAPLVTFDRKLAAAYLKAAKEVE